MAAGDSSVASVDRAASERTRAEAVAEIIARTRGNAEDIRGLIAALTAERHGILREMKPLQDELASNHEAASVARDALATLILSDGGIPDWDFLLDTRNDSRIVNAALKHRAEPLGLAVGGEWVDTRQRALKLALVRGSEESRQQTIDAVRAILPYVKAHPDGWVRFGISEHTLNVYGVYRLAVKPDLSEIRVDDLHSSRSFPDLEAAVAYVQERHWMHESPSDAEEAEEEGPRPQL